MYTIHICYFCIWHRSNGWKSGSEARNFVPKSPVAIGVPSTGYTLMPAYWYC